jgi:polar amino acid transport system permease protein
MTTYAVSNTKEPFFFYFVACMLYLAMSILSSFGIGAIERWSERGDRQRTAGAPAGGQAPA